MRPKGTIHIFPILLYLFILTISFSVNAQAKSLYVITNRSSTVAAYDIQGEQIEHQINAQNLPDHGYGAVGLALDPDTATLFVTYENSNIIEMVNAKSMISEQNPATVLLLVVGIVWIKARERGPFGGIGPANIYVQRKSHRIDID